MRIIGPLFLIIFVIATVYLTKDDAALFVHNVENKYFTTQIKSDKQINEPVNENLTENQPQSFKKESITPGPLIQNNTNIDVSLKLSPTQIIAKTIRARTENGVTPLLIENQKLHDSAQKKVDDMFKNNYFEHISPSGVSVSDLGDQVGYDYIIIGENLALGSFKTEQELVDAWMASPGHRANILNPKYRDIGVAVGYGTILGHTTWIAVQHFGVSTSICPQVDTTLKSSIENQTLYIGTQAGELEAQKAIIDESKMYEKGYADNVDSYNNNVQIYNQLVEKIKSAIQQYNNQVNSFNLCISELEE